MIYAVVAFVVGILLSQRHTVYAVLLAQVPLIGAIVAQTWTSGTLTVGLSTLAACGSLQLGFFVGAIAKFMTEPAEKRTSVTTEQLAAAPVAACSAAKLARIRRTDRG